ncbi:tRNA-binding protein [Lactobacillus coryniformis subsp. coryniformis KCTC 3167 = DSM] [Dolosigranulum pigrum]|nr:tRNA-binding protein [Lactobacillus coryniformis subsp. coryniformis KCTC 3167 = DSM] [Dolosigranulum pigrum]
MIATSYNNKGLTDTLIITLAQSDVADQTFKRKGNITEIKRKDQVVGYNIFQVSELIDLLESGPVQLTADQVDRLNSAIQAAGFDGRLEADTSPKFVVGYVKECKPHEDSDHLSITQVEVDGGDVLQIVCGASNIAQDQTVVVAKPGAIMPDGMIIYPGELRGVESLGMICSARELGIESNQKKGILVLDNEYEVGQAFQF